MKALLFSGGIESTCLAYQHRPDVCLTIDYGQVSAGGEITASKLIARYLKLDHDIMKANAREFGMGLLAGQRTTSLAHPEFWPFRNQLLITLAAMRFYKLPSVELMIGTIRSDSKHADGTIHFLRAMKHLLEVQRTALHLRYPALKMSTSSLIRKSGVPIELLGFTFSCHTSTLACGRCPGCIKNLEAREFALSLFQKGERPTKLVQPKRFGSSRRLCATN